MYHKKWHFSEINILGEKLKKCGNANVKRCDSAPPHFTRISGESIDGAGAFSCQPVVASIWLSYENSTVITRILIEWCDIDYGN